MIYLSNLGLVLPGLWVSKHLCLGRVRGTQQKGSQHTALLNLGFSWISRMHVRKNGKTINLTLNRSRHSLNSSAKIKWMTSKKVQEGFTVYPWWCWWYRRRRWICSGLKKGFIVYLWWWCLWCRRRRWIYWDLKKAQTWTITTITTITITTYLFLWQFSHLFPPSSAS